MNQRERMLNGLPYKAWLDGLEEDRQACKQKIYDFNIDVVSKFNERTTNKLLIMKQY